ncbi:MAG: hypothetical protein JW861_04490 [Bacteroidales bacterium]|nr:hypothetical protein [Bacteroidales bacterium]
METKTYTQRGLLFPIRKTTGIWVMLAFMLLWFTSEAYHINIDTLYTRQWNHRKEGWDLVDRTIVIRGDASRLTEVVQIQCRKKWVNYSMKSYQYYQPAKPSVVEEMFWSEAELRWKETYLHIYSYDPSGRLISVTGNHVFTDSIIPDIREVMNYSENGVQCGMVTMRYTDGWQYQMRRVFGFSEDGQKVSETVSYWNGADWDDPVCRVTYDYDRHGHLSMMTRSRRELPGSWQFVMRERYSCDAVGNMLASSAFCWDGKRGEWYETAGTVYEVNQNILHGTTRISDGIEWMNYLSADLLLPCETGDIRRESCLLSFQVIPGLFSKQITLEFENPGKELYHLIILNNQGDVIEECDLPDNRITLDTRSLVHGEYIVELSGDGTFAGRFVID